MEVYAFGFRNQSGVAFGPKGSRFENALAVSDNGANDLGNRRIANGAEKLWIVTEKGQDGGFPDKEGMLFVNTKRYGWDFYRGNPVLRPYPQPLHRRQAVHPARSTPTTCRSTSTATAACR